MDPIVFGLIAGLCFGTLAVLLMLPLSFPDRRRALAAAFASRFAIGLLVPLTQLPWPGAATGALVGALVSLPDALVTKAYVPIMLVGTLGGATIGWLAHQAP